MAFSGFQKTRLGLAAFARSLYGSFAGKAEKVAGPTTSFGVFSLIDASGQGSIGFIDETGQGLSSAIDSNGQGLVSLINDSGSGVGSGI